MRLLGGEWKASGCEGRRPNWARKSRGESSESRREENEALCDNSGFRDRGVVMGAGAGDRSCRSLDEVGRSDERRWLLDRGSADRGSAADEMRFVIGVVEWTDGTGDGECSAVGSDCRLLTRAMRDCGG